MAVASISGKRKIVLKASYSEGGTEQDEGIASGAVSPGMNVVLTQLAAINGRDTWVAGASNAVGTGTSDTPTGAQLTIAKEAVLNQGKTVDDAYADGDNLFLHHAKPGDVLLVLVASGQTVLKGRGLSAASTGKFTVVTSNAPCIALETSGGALAADTLVRVLVL